MPATARPDRDAIYAELRRDIMEGALPPSAPLREMSLAERFGVSRTPVRDVLSRLEQAGLATRGGRGLEVASIDPQTVVQIYDLRILLEVEATGQAAEQRSVRDVLRLQALVERDQALDDPDDRVRVQSNLEFHRAVWDAAHNPVLQDLLGRLSEHLVHAPHSTLSVGDRWPESLREHHAIVDAIEARDVEAARQLAREHFTTARALRLQLLREMVARQDVTALS